MDQKKERRFVALVRVSSAIQAQNGVSLQAQREQITGQVALWGGKIVEWVTEEGVSAKSVKHWENIQKILRFLEADQADGVVVLALDRLCRNTRQVLEIVERINAAGKDLCSLRESLDTATPHGRFAITVMSAAAALERELAAERTYEVREYLKSKGQQWSPVVPYGAKVERRGKKKYILPNMEEINTMEQVLMWHGQGLTWRECADRLNAMNVPTKNNSAEKIKGRFGVPPPKRDKFDTGAWTPQNLCSRVTAVRKLWPEFDELAISYGMTPLDQLRKGSAGPPLKPSIQNTASEVVGA